MATSDRHIEIAKDTIHGSGREGYTAEEHEIRDGMEARRNDSKAMPDLPHEWPEFTDEEMAEIKAARGL